MRCSAHTTPLSDSSATYMWVVWLAPSPTGLLFEQSVAEASRFSRREFPNVPGFFDRAGVNRHSHKRGDCCCLPPQSTRSASGKRLFRGSIAQPIRAPVNASPAASPPPAHDSGSARFATPFAVGLFHPQLPAGLSRRFLTGAPLKPVVTIPRENAAQVTVPPIWSSFDLPRRGTSTNPGPAIGAFRSRLDRRPAGMPLARQIGLAGRRLASPLAKTAHIAFPVHRDPPTRRIRH
jgi:hypothetical protein